MLYNRGSVTLASHQPVLTRLFYQITRRGEVVDEPTFRYNTARKEHRTHVKELMSQAVINKTLELEVS